MSRRDLLGGGAAAVIAGGAAALFAQAPAGARAPAPPGLATNAGGVIFWGNNPGNVDPASILAERQGPTKTSGTKFKALVRIERGLFDAKSMVGQMFGPDGMKEAVQVAADRSAITSVIQFLERWPAGGSARGRSIEHWCEYEIALFQNLADGQQPVSETASAYLSAEERAGGRSPPLCRTP